MWTHCTIVGVGDHYHNNISYTIRITRTGHIVTRNTKHIKITPITAEEYFRKIALDIQIIWWMEYLNSMKHTSWIKCKAVLAIKGEETYMNKFSDSQSNNTQGCTINIVPNNSELTENSEQTVSD